MKFAGTPGHMGDSDKHPALGLGSGPDFGAIGLSPVLASVISPESAWDPLPLSPYAPPLITISLSQINNLNFEKRKNYAGTLIMNL